MIYGFLYIIMNLFKDILIHNNVLYKPNKIQRGHNGTTLFTIRLYKRSLLDPDRQDDRQTSTSSLCQDKMV